MELLGAILILQVVGLSLIRRVADHRCPGGGRAENKSGSIQSQNVLAE